MIRYFTPVVYDEFWITIKIFTENLTEVLTKLFSKSTAIKEFNEFAFCFKRMEN